MSSINFENVYRELSLSLSIDPVNVTVREIENTHEIRISAQGIGDSYKFAYDLNLSLDKVPPENHVNLSVYPMTGTQAFTMSSNLRNTTDLQKYVEKWTSIYNIIR